MKSELHFRKRRTQMVETQHGGAGIHYGTNGAPNMITLHFTKPGDDTQDKMWQTHELTPQEALDLGISLLSNARHAAPGIKIPQTVMDELLRVRREILY